MPPVPIIEWLEGPASMVCGDAGRTTDRLLNLDIRPPILITIKFKSSSLSLLTGRSFFFPYRSAGRQIIADSRRPAYRKGLEAV